MASAEWHDDGSLWNDDFPVHGSVPFSASSLLAQQAGAINGQVTDQGGGAIPNAQVAPARAGRETVFEVTTNSAGEYSIPALEAGTYNLQVTAPGFERFEAAGIVLRVSRTERVDAKLAVGAVTAEVNVSGSELGTVQTESPEISFTITGKQITQLVLNGRNFTQLVTLSPGVINSDRRGRGLNRGRGQRRVQRERRAGPSTTTGSLTAPALWTMAATPP